LVGGEGLRAPLVRRDLTTLPEDTVVTVFLPFERIAYVFDPRQFLPVAGPECDCPACDAPGATTVIALNSGMSSHRQN
jgi:hypothetical protein